MKNLKNNSNPRLSLSVDMCALSSEIQTLFVQRRGLMEAGYCKPADDDGKEGNKEQWPPAV